MQAKNQLHRPCFSGDTAKICKLILLTLGKPGYVHPKWSYELVETSMFICIPKINFVIPFFLEILQFKETCSLIGRQHFFCPITQEPEFCQIWGWWWNTNKNISLHSRLFPGKTSGKIFQKIPQNSILGPFWALFAQIWAKIIYHRGKNQKKTNDPFLIKIPKWQTDGNTDRQIERQTNRQTDRQTQR